MTNTLHPIIAQYIAAMNAFDINGIVATFADDAFVNDVQREFWGSDAIRRWVEKEIVGDQVTMDLLAERMQVHEKQAWMLRSILQ